MMQARKWWIVGLLFLATLLNYFDRQILSLVSPTLRVEFGLSAHDYSLLLDAFLLGYTSLQFAAGWIIDRVGAKKGLILAMLWWSGAGALAAGAHGLPQLAVCLFLMGVGEAANWPSAVKAVQEWFPNEQRAAAIGIFNAGSSVGAILAPIVVTRLTLAYSWRSAFVVCGILGAVWILPWMLFYSHSEQQQMSTTKKRGDFSCLLTVRPWGVILARFFADSIWFFYIFWLPDYLSRVQKLSLREIGAMAWIPFVAAAAGNFAGGYASGLLIRKGVQPVRARVVVMGVAATLMCVGAITALCHTPLLAIACISVATFAYSAWAANVLSLPGDIAPSAFVATLTGVSGTVAGIGGALTTLVTGVIVDRVSYGPVIAALGVWPLIAFSVVLLVLIERSPSRVQNAR